MRAASPAGTQRLLILGNVFWHGTNPSENIRRINELQGNPYSRAFRVAQTLPGLLLQKFINVPKLEFSMRTEPLLAMLGGFLGGMSVIAVNVDAANGSCGLRVRPRSDEIFELFNRYTIREAHCFETNFR